MNCESCALPMQKPEDHGGGDITNKYCKFCAPDGKLISREEVREGWTRYIYENRKYLRGRSGKKSRQRNAKNARLEKVIPIVLLS